MLSLPIEPGEKLDRHLEVLGRSLASLVEAGLKEGIVYLRAYPHPGAVAAASLAFTHLSGLGVRAALKVSVKPPPRVDAPTLLLGYPSLNYKASDVSSRLLALVRSEYAKGHPPPGAVYAGVDGSLSSAYLMAVEASGLGGLDASVKALALSGIYLDGKVSRSGKIGGIDRVLVERLSRRGDVSLRVVTTLKVYKPHSRTLCDSAVATLVPLVHLGSTSEECAEVLAGSGLRRAAEKAAASLEPSEIDSILEVIADKLDADIDAGEYVAGLLVADNARPDDPREASHALLYAAESSGDYGPIVSAFVNPDIEYTAVEILLERRAPAIKEALLSARPSRLRGPGWLRLYSLGSGAPAESPTLSYMALRSAGFIDNDVVLGIPAGEEIRISPLQASLVDYTLPKRLVESRAAAEEGLWMTVRVEE